MLGNHKTEFEMTRSAEHHRDTTLLGTCYWLSADNNNSSPISAIDDATSICDCKNIFENLTGFFSVVTRASNKWIIAVDPLQSIPLYYISSAERTYITDSQQQVKRHSNSSRDEISLAEYRTATYTTGPHTLLEDVYQVEPGTFIIVNDNSIKTKRYFQYAFHDQQRITRADLDRVVEVIINRLKNYAGGRPIWIPLSAGYDSRLLATALAEDGYDELYTFSYGQTGNYESVKSKKVAASLGIPWKFVEYSHQKWRQAFQSEDRASFDASVELITVPPLREWMAVRELYINGVMSEDSIIVPGHSADFLAGSHIPTKWHGRKSVSKKELIDKIITDHYQYNDYNQKEEREIRKRIERITDFSGGSGSAAIEAYERWDWQARQVRQITAHVWPHENLGLDWWMPFWDRDFLDFWLEVALEQRLDRRFYNDYVWHRYKRAADNPVLPEGFADTPVGRFQYWIKRSRFGPAATKLYNAVGNSDSELSAKDAYNHSMANTGMMEFETFERLYNGDRNARSYRARERLGEVEF